MTVQESKSMLNKASVDKITKGKLSFPQALSFHEKFQANSSKIALTNGTVVI